MCIVVDFFESEFICFYKDRDFDIYIIMINYKFLLGLLFICCNLIIMNFMCIVFF